MHDWDRKVVGDVGIEYASTKLQTTEEVLKLKRQKFEKEVAELAPAAKQTSNNS